MTGFSIYTVPEQVEIKESELNHSTEEMNMHTGPNDPEGIQEFEMFFIINKTLHTNITVHICLYICHKSV